MTSDRWKILARENVPVALCLIASGLMLLCNAPQAVAAATYHVVGSATLLHPTPLSLSTTVARPSRDDVYGGHDAILLRGLIPSPLALPPLHPHATRRSTLGSVASLCDDRRPQLPVEVERACVHVKRRAPVTPAFVRQVDRDVHTAKVRDAFVSDAARRGPPSVHRRPA